MNLASVRPITISLGGALVLVSAIEVVGLTGIAGRAWPPLSQVVMFALEEGAWGPLMRAAGSTLLTALLGFGFGLLLAAVMAILSLIVPPTRVGLGRFAAILNALPAIALAPILLLFVGREVTPVAIATLNTFFVFFVAFMTGLSSSRSGHQDVFTVFGADRIQRLARLQLPSAVPAVADGFVLAAPAAIMGAILGEWFGASRGLGVIIVSAMRNFQTDLLWAAALIATVASLVTYLALRWAQTVVRERWT